MKQPDKKARKEYMKIVTDAPAEVAIPGTRRTVKIRGIKPYTLERLTALWLEREMKMPSDSSETLKDMSIEPYFSVKEAALFVLNGYWRIRLFYPFLWRWWGKIKGYTESQMTPIIREGKKKLQLRAHWRNMAYSTDMRTDWMRMTAKEAEQYRAEQLSEAKQLSSVIFPLMGKQDASSSDSSALGTGATDAN